MVNDDLCRLSNIEKEGCYHVFARSFVLVFSLWCLIIVYLERLALHRAPPGRSIGKNVVTLKVVCDIYKRFLQWSMDHLNRCY